jgi:hypothetical protein
VNGNRGWVVVENTRALFYAAGGEAVKTRARAIWYEHHGWIRMPDQYARTRKFVGQKL